MEIQNADALAKFRKTLALLLEKSRADAVSWRLSSSRSRGDELTAEFPNGKIAIQFISPSADPDFYLAALETDHGEPRLSLRTEEGEPDWELLSKLYVEAERSATRWDLALAEIDRYLQEGKQPERAAAARRPEATDDDIPF